MKSKTSILNTRMNQLGLGGAFNGWFFNPRHMQPEEVLTVAEFIKLNQTMKTNKEHFVCWNSEEVRKKLWRNGFIKESTSFRKLKNFLIDKKFTHKDWVILLPDVQSAHGTVPDYKLLDKKVLLQIEVHKITDVKVGCLTYSRISNFVFSNTEFDNDPLLKVVDIINLKPEEIEDGLPMNTENRAARKTLLSIQKKLRGYGFSTKDGPFMDAFLEKPYKKEAHIEYLMKNRNFSKRDALRAVDLGKRAGWI